jgi:hypothetical protein
LNAQSAATTVVDVKDALSAALGGRASIHRECGQRRRFRDSL